MTRDRTLGIVLVFALVLVAALSVAVLTTRTAEQSASAQEADRFNAANPATVPASAAGAGSGAVVTVVGDDMSAVSSTGTVAPWPLLAERALDADIVSLSVSGSGFVRQPTRNAFGGTIGIRASQVDADSKVVVIAGGANDVGVSSLRLLTAAVQSVRAAQSAAPKATVILIGPTSTSIDPPETVQEVTDTLARAAKLAHVRFVDPIAGRWLVGVKRAVTSNGVALAPAGQAVVTDKMVAILRPLL